MSSRRERTTVSADFFAAREPSLAAHRYHRLSLRRSMSPPGGFAAVVRPIPTTVLLRRHTDAVTECLVEMRQIVEPGVDRDGRSVGRFVSTGVRPRFADRVKFSGHEFDRKALEHMTS